MRYRPIDHDPEDPRLGRYIPDDWGHVEKYPLSAVADELPQQVPVVIGINWYREMDKPTQDPGSGEYFISSSLTRIRGGHCVCLEPGGEKRDRDEWWDFYNQGKEGACVGFGWSRCMSLLNQELDPYMARWLWDRCKERDQWPQTNPGDDEGTSVRAGGEALTETGHVRWDDSFAADDHNARRKYKPDIDLGLTSFRWGETVDEVHAVLGNEQADELGAVPILNSWGTSYPHRTWLPDEALERVMKEEGEIAIPIDR